MILRLKILITIPVCFIFLFTITFNVFGQEEEFPTEIPLEAPQPPMKNIFYNVLWGSITGGTLMMAWSVLQDDESQSKEERQKFSTLTGKFLEGATYGGVLGFIAGVYLSMKNISFDENKTRIAFFEPAYTVPLNDNAMSLPAPDQIYLMHVEVNF